MDKKTYNVMLEIEASSKQGVLNVLSGGKCLLDDFRVKSFYIGDDEEKTENEDE